MEKTLEAVKVLKNGGVVAYPGDTYYALGANIYDDQAIAKVLQLKGLGAGVRPIPVAVSSLNQLEDVAQVGSDHRIVIEKLWPGPFLFLLPKRASVSSLLTGPSNLIGVIYFHNDIAGRLIERSGFPLTATSANLTGEKETHHPDKIEVEYDLLLKGICPFGGMELTVVDLFNRRIVQSGIWVDRAEKLLF